MENFLKKYRMVLLIALVLIVVPLIIAGFYNRPSADDLCQPLEARRALLSGGGLFAALQASFKSMIDLYRGWNGTYFNLLFACISPMIGSTKLAWIHPIVFMGMIPLCLSVLLSTLRQILHFSKVASTCCVLLLSCLFLLLMPSISEGIFWYTGGISYAFMFCYSVLLCAGLLSWVFISKAPKKRNILLVFLCIGLFLLGGTNFSTSTITIVLLGYLTLYVLFFRKDRRAILLPFLCLLAGYGLAVLAPGNTNRFIAENFERYTLPVAFFYTFRDTLSFIFRDMRFYIFLLLFLPIAVAIVQQTNVEYRHPLLALLLSFLVVAAGFMPPVYAEHFVGPYRLLNIQFFITCFFYVFNLVYLTGFILRRLQQRGLQLSTDNGLGSQRSWIVYTVVVCLLFTGTLFSHATLEPFKMQSDIPSIKAASNLLDGQLKTYAEEYDQLVAIAESMPGQDITTSRVPSNPLFKSMDIKPEADYWENVSFSKYFGCSSIRLVP